MLKKISFALSLFIVAVCVGVIAGWAYSGDHFCTACKGEQDYCTKGDKCKIKLLPNLPATFAETKSGKYCNGWSFTKCTDKTFECWCETPVGSAGDADADLPGCE
jgi:hypothetical protein